MAKPQESYKKMATPTAEEKEPITPFDARNESCVGCLFGRRRQFYLALIATQELGKAVCITGISPSVSQIQQR